MMSEKLTLPYNNDYHPDLGIYKCRICGVEFEKSETSAWEIHKLNHTLVALKNIIDRYTSQGERLY